MNRNLRPSRRAFLRAAAAAPFAAVAASCGRGPEARPGGPAVPSRGTALIVGGGLCGLRLLELLLERGFDARLVEGGSRLGGRVFTVRDGLPAGLRAEMGAERIPPRDMRVLSLADRLGVPTATYPPIDGPIRVRFKGLVANYGDADSPLFDGTTERERTRGALHVHLALVDSAKPVAPDDPRTAIAWLRDLGLSNRGEELVRAFTYHDVDRLPAATFAAFCARENAGFGSTTIAGGTDRLIDALATKLSDRVERGFKAVRVETTSDAATVRDAAGAARSADVVVLAMSAAATKRLVFEPALPTIAARLSALESADELKVCAAFPKGASEAVGDSAADVFPRAAWRMPEIAADGSYVLNTMAVRDDLPKARAAARAGPAALLALMNARLPASAPFAPKWIAHDWREDPLFGGAFAFARSAAGLGGGPQREGRVILAGGDVSSVPGWLEGALESAEDVASELTS